MWEIKWQIWSEGIKVDIYFSRRRTCNRETATHPQFNTTFGCFLFHRENPQSAFKFYRTSYTAIHRQAKMKHLKLLVWCRQKYCNVAEHFSHRIITNKVYVWWAASTVLRSLSKTALQTNQKIIRSSLAFIISVHVFFFSLSFRSLLPVCIQFYLLWILLFRPFSRYLFINSHIMNEHVACRLLFLLLPACDVWVFTVYTTLEYFMQKRLNDKFLHVLNCFTFLIRFCISIK